MKRARLYLGLTTRPLLREFNWHIVRVALLNFERATGSWTKLDRNFKQIPTTLKLDFIYHNFSIELQKNGHGVLYDPQDPTHAYKVLAPRHIEDLLREIYDLYDMEIPINMDLN